MAKSKKRKAKNRKSVLYRTLKPIISDNRILFSMLGAAAVGAGLAAMVGSEKGKEIIDRITEGARELTHFDVADAKKPVVTKKTA